MTIYDFKVKDIIGRTTPLNNFKGKVLLIVNTATECGLTPQYPALQRLYDDYNEKGFEILDFPSNQFNQQAPGTSEEIHKVCTGRFGITFNQYAKIDVNGENEDPLYTYLKKQKGGLFGSKIKWNFTKFLIDRQGKVTKRYAPTVKPDAIRKDIEKLL